MLQYGSFRSTVKYNIAPQTPKLFLKNPFFTSIRMSEKSIKFDDKKSKKRDFCKNNNNNNKK